MSKAMDALELVWRIMCDGGDTDIEACAAACALLRDYITTTEAERAAKEACGVVPCPECGGDGADHEDSSENCWNCNGDGVVRDTRNPMSASDESAARIKELEEALDAAQKSMDGFAKGFRDDSVASQWAKATAADLRDALSALDGARKVNSLGSVRGDEHLGAMLPDEAIFDARKVEHEGLKGGR